MARNFTSDTPPPSYDYNANQSNINRRLNRDDDKRRLQSPHSRKFAVLAGARLNEQYFFEKECDRFCPDSKKPNKCQCGLMQTDHSPEVLKKPEGVKWTSDECTKKTKWRCFGTIRFKNQETLHSGSPYMRIADDVPVDRLVERIHTKWKLSKPSLIISVTGGAGAFEMKKKDHERLRQGLQRVAATKGAWVITGGTNAGIMKICGEAVRDHMLSSVNSTASDRKNQVVTIGIATWGSIKGYEEYLIPPEDHEAGKDYEAHYQKPVQGTGLDPNHTHFIFADDGSRGLFGREQGLRGKFEKVVRDNGVGKKSTAVPIVCVMVEGGPGTIDTARNALLNNTPCVVIDGSGRGADVLAFAVEAHSKRFKDESLSKEEREAALRKAVSDKSEKILQLSGSKLEETVDWLIECLSYKDKIRVFKFDEEDGESAGDLDKAILQTLLEMGGLDIRTQLELALLWNRVDMAEQVLRRNNDKVDLRDIEEFLTKSLIDNKIDFVKIFSERVSLPNFLTKAKLEELYNETLKVSTDKFLLETLESKERKRRSTFREMKDICDALSMRVNIVYSPQFSKVERTELGLSVMASCYDTNSGDSGKKRRTNINKVHQSEEPPTGDTSMLTFLHPERELFIYSLLFIRPEMSYHFWDEMLNKTSGALFAVLVSKTILKSSVVKVDINLQLKVQQMLHNYEFKAKGILNNCYEVSAKTCQTVLKVEHKALGGKTCLDLAEKADCKEFIAQSGCQTLVREIWLGKISDRNALWKVTLTALFPFLIYFIWFKADVNKEQTDLERDRKQLRESQTDISYKQQSDGDLTALHQSDNKLKKGNLSVLSSNRINFRTTTNSDFGENDTIVRSDTAEIVGGDTLLVQDSQDSVVGPSGEVTAQELYLLNRLTNFYKAPIVTFILNLASYVIFLVLFSMVTMEGLKKDPEIVEYVVMFWLFTMGLEEVRQFFIISEPTFVRKVEVFCENRWNIVDTMALFIFIPGLVMRCNYEWDLMNVAHSFYVLSLILYFVRSTYVFSMHNYLGPKIVMIAKMLSDLGFFICIVLVYLVAYGIAVQSLVYPGISEPIFSVPWGIFFRPFFEMLGEAYMEEIGATDASPCESVWPYETCPDDRKVIFALILKVIYMIFTNVLLLNLLIAIFNNRYEDVNEQSNVYWRFQVFEVIKEYYNRPSLPPPFIIISHSLSLIKAMKNRRIPKMARLTEMPRDMKKLEKWEDIRAKEFASLTDKELQENIEERVRKIEGRSVAIDKSITTVKSELWEMRLNQEKSMRQFSSTREMSTLEEQQLPKQQMLLQQQQEQQQNIINKLCSLETSMGQRDEETEEKFRRIESMLEMLVMTIATSNTEHVIRPTQQPNHLSNPNPPADPTIARPITPSLPVIDLDDIDPQR